MGLLLVLFVVFPAAAEYYRYQDEHGNTIYTDDLSKVPPDQRANIASYDESISKPFTKPEEKPAALNPTPANISEADDKELRQLEKEGDRLTQEYQALAIERDKLDKEKEQAVTRRQIKDYNKKIIDFNTRIKAYEEKRDAHTLAVQKFNDRMAAKETNTQTQ